MKSAIAMLQSAMIAVQAYIIFSCSAFCFAPDAGSKSCFTLHPFLAAYGFIPAHAALPTRSSRNTRSSLPPVNSCPAPST